MRTYRSQKESSDRTESAPEGALTPPEAGPKEIGPPMSKKQATCTGEPKPGAQPLDKADVADSLSAIAETFGSDGTLSGVCVADGWGVRIRVERGALEVTDGLGPHRRIRRFEKATHRLRRLVVPATTGMVTFEALRWCQALGIGVAVMATDGTPTLASVPRETDDARLRRIQARAPDLPVGVDITRALLGQKMTAQAQLLASRFEDHETACMIIELAEAGDRAGTVEELRQLEASAASLYWHSWTGRSECVPRFASADLRRIPAHWNRYEGRRSVLTSANGNRKAERPVNAMANYLYALLEIEAILACQVVGLDPGLAIVHSDARGRRSMALDLMEPVRPQIDAFVLDLIDGRTFKKSNFT